MKTLIRGAIFFVLSLSAAHADIRPLPNQDYRVKLTKNTGGLNIGVHASSGPAVAVGLDNRSDKVALCSASFVSYPHNATMDETRSTTVAPGKRATLAYPAAKLGGNFSTAFVDVKCHQK